MQVVRAAEVAADASGNGMAASWLAGPTRDQQLDIGLISFDAGSVTPLHVHHVGQVLVVASGSGYVQTEDGERVEISRGDIVVTPAGEWHVHGADGSGPMTHLSVTTGTNDVRLDADS